MGYATRADLEVAYGADEVAQRESALPAGAVDRALADADALIDGYVAGRYAVPLSPMPANLPRLACAIARYHLLGDAAGEPARDAYAHAIAWLKDVQSGRVVLPGVAAAAAPATGGTAAIRTPPRLFDADTLAGY